ncbi:MAG: hypothetical protein JNL57_13170 [Bacteroidetes bacterium]|nr:hypothetical protein [Bacteroidota bacterium]
MERWEGKPVKRWVISVCCFLTVGLQSQNLEQIAKGDLLQVSGNLGYQQWFSHSRGMSAARKPVGFLLNGSLNFQILGFVNAPFTFFFSNQGNGYTQPGFNQVALHPQWKWIRLNIGRISPVYSGYTLNGHLMDGVAAELSPGRFQFGFFTGRFQRAIIPEPGVSDADILPAFRRTGQGIKAGYAIPGKTLVQGVCIRIHDHVESIPPPAAYSGITPMANLATSLSVQHTLSRRLSLQAEGAVSILNEDLYQAGPRLSVRQLSGLKISTYPAVKAGLRFSPSAFNLGLNYERVSPGYRTLGAYYFVNDLENLHISSDFRLARGKVSVALQGGLQHDNLNQSRLSSMLRRVGSVNLGLRPASHTQFQLSYSNFISYTNLRAITDVLTLKPYEWVDTLQFRQVARQAAVSLTRSFRRAGGMSAFNGQFNWQQSGDAGHAGERRNQFVNAVFTWSSQQQSSGRGISAGINTSRSDWSQNSLWTMAPVLQFQQPFAAKAGIWQASASYAGTLRNRDWVPGTWNLRSSAAYTLHKIHRFSLQAWCMHRASSALYPKSSEFAIIFSWQAGGNWGGGKR